MEACTTNLNLPEPPKRRAQKRRVSSTTSSDDSDFRTHHCPDPTKAILPADLSVKNVIENRRRSGEPRINFWQYFLPKPKEKENRASDLRRKQPRLSTEGQIDTLDADHELEELSLHNTTNHALKQRKGSLAIKDLAIDPRAAPMVPASLSPFGIPLVAAAGRSGSASVSSTPSNTMPLLRARPLELPSRDSRPQVAEALLPKTLESSLNDASSIKHKINSPTAVDLTLEDAPPVQAGSLSLSSDSPILRQRPPMDDDILTRHIQNHTILNFVPLPPLPLRTRPFSKCNTLQKLYGQAQQSGLFAQEMPLGRFLEINIMGVKTMGIPEEDEEDFDEFVRELKMAPCWKKKDEEGIDWKGDCTVEVRLKT